MTVKWTDKQQKVIDTRGRNILVSAAAGSGKTAVLVERIVQKVTDKHNPIDVDKLLVVTFTKAAAAEMRERVLEALEKASESNPDDEHLQRQQTYIHNAQITTIDSFCAKIIREHFDKIDLDPNTKIVDEPQMRMLQSEVVTKLVEEKYEEGNSEFLELADKYTDPKNRNAIEKMVVDLYKCCNSHIAPKQWLNSCKAFYEIDSIDELKNTSCIKKLVDLARDSIFDIISNLDAAIKITNEDDGPKQYFDELALVKASMEKVQDISDYNELRNAISHVSFNDRVATVKKGSCDESLKEQAKGLRDDAKKKLASLTNGLLSQKLEDVLEDIKKVKNSALALLDLTIQFYDELAIEKKEKCIMDFSDQEHYALSILAKINEDGTFEPTQVAREIATNLEEVMIDEYQDSNFIQEAILTSVSRGAGINNVFMVGDVKQSIYKFRLANPNLFIDKYDTYSEDLSEDCCKIILDKNFRSRSEIIDSVNYVFNCIMNKSLGGIGYDDGNELFYGADYEELPEGQDNSTEVVFVEGSGNENEARAVARKIKELVNPENGFVISTKDGKYRTPTYRDIVVLLRSTANRGDEYVKVFEQEGVEAYCESKEGYYAAKEVKTVIDFLSIIDNPLQDIPLASVMRSEMFEFSSEELACIKTLNDKYYYFDNVKLYLESGDNLELKTKIKGFLELLTKYRKMVSYTSVYELIKMILNDTGFDLYISALPNGNRRIKNIEILKEKAVAYDNGIYKGLFNFVRYIEKIKEMHMDEGEATPVNESDNIVRIMTFHKSKGLQFPIVFVSGLGAKFYDGDTREKVVVHDKYGVGLDCIDEKIKVKAPTVLKTVIKNVIQEENYSEYIRLLYVAMTRAQEKMYLTGSIGNVEDKLISWLNNCECDEEKVSRSKLLKTNTFIDWIGLSLCKNKGIIKALKQVDMSPKIGKGFYKVDSKIESGVVFEEEIVSGTIEETIASGFSKEILKQWDTDVEYDIKIKDSLKKHLNWEYPYGMDNKIPAKLSVTEIKKLSMEQEDDEVKVYAGKDEALKQKIPEFLKNDDDNVILTGAQRGSAYHRVFELLDLSIEPTYNNIEAMLINLLETGKISKETKDCIEINDILKFTKTSLYERMKQADKRGQLFRERPFMMGINSNDIALYKSYGCDETILVQGIIDVCFIEDGKFVIADYKTDNVDSLKELVERYEVQLTSYKDAIEKIDDIRVKDMIIYSVKLGDEITV